MVILKVLIRYFRAIIFFLVLVIFEVDVDSIDEFNVSVLEGRFRRARARSVFVFLGCAALFDLIALNVEIALLLVF